MAAILSLERLQYPNIMTSFLQTIEGQRVIIANALFSTGEKWKAIAPATKRSFDSASDILPLVLKRRRSRFVKDSRIDQECDQLLCRQLALVSQHVMPLATDSLMIGTLQVDMGIRQCEPTTECLMLDAVAAHLSTAIERHRVLAQVEVANSELLNQAKLVAYQAAAADIVHKLFHSIGEYGRQLNTAMRNPEVRSNKAAVDFLKFTQKSVEDWIEAVEQAVRAPRADEKEGKLQVDENAKVAIEMWHRKAEYRHCMLKVNLNAPGACVTGKPSDLKELLSCLIVNAIEASARNVWIETRIVEASGSTATERRHVELAVSDDGHGIPEEFKASINRFGWTSKSKEGHGMGLSIVSLLSKKMGAAFALRSCGKSAGEQRTQFAVLIPLTPI